MWMASDAADPVSSCHYRRETEAVAAKRATMEKTRRLAGKVAIVTGASSGIGRAAALQFAREGAKVAFLSRGLEAGEAAADEARESGATAVFISTDVSVAEQVDAAVSSVVERWGRLDVMFNAAGISGRSYGDGPVVECTLDGWDTVIGANLTSMFLCSKFAVAAMLRSGGGSLINLASVLGMVGGDEDFATHAYAASKGGIIALTRAIASYYAPQGIRANVIAPGLIRTNMSRRAQSSEAIKAKLTTLQPLTGDFGEADDVADAALYLASDESRFVTGIVLPVDGGWTTR
jgi:NAD(P)-dependent dehydrogenase (short-subunit alcohol dehydrogenase family)